MALIEQKDIWNEQLDEKSCDTELSPSNVT